MNTIEKTVDQCKIDLNVREARLVFLLYCRHGKYSISYAKDKISSDYNFINRS